MRLTGRGAIAALFALCFLTQLVADWAGLGTLAGAAFVCGCGVVTYYTKTSGLRMVVVTPPLVFLAGCALAETLTEPGISWPRNRPWSHWVPRPPGCSPRPH